MIREENQQAIQVKLFKQEAFLKLYQIQQQLKIWGTYGKLYEGVIKQNQESVLMELVTEQFFKQYSELINNELIFTHISNNKNENVVQILDYIQIEQEDNYMIVRERYMVDSIFYFINNLNSKTILENNLRNLYVQTYSGMRSLSKIQNLKRILNIMNVCFKDEKPLMSLYDNNHQYFKNFFYIAPELIDRNEIQTSEYYPAQVYALGVIFYYLALNEIPYSAQSKQEYLKKIEIGLDDLKSHQRIVIAKYSPQLVDLLIKMLKQDPKDRIQYDNLCEHQFFLELKKHKFDLRPTNVYELNTGNISTMLINNKKSEEQLDEDQNIAITIKVRKQIKEEQKMIEVEELKMSQIELQEQDEDVPEQTKQFTKPQKSVNQKAYDAFQLKVSQKYNQVMTKIILLQEIVWFNQHFQLQDPYFIKGYFYIFAKQALFEIIEVQQFYNLEQNSNLLEKYINEAFFTNMAQKIKFTEQIVQFQEEQSKQQTSIYNQQSENPVVNRVYLEIKSLDKVHGGQKNLNDDRVLVKQLCQLLCFDSPEGLEQPLDNIGELRLQLLLKRLIDIFINSIDVDNIEVYEEAMTQILQSNDLDKEKEQVNSEVLGIAFRD